MSKSNPVDFNPHNRAFTGGVGKPTKPRKNILGLPKSFKAPLDHGVVQKNPLDPGRFFVRVRSHAEIYRANYPNHLPALNGFEAESNRPDRAYPVCFPNATVEWYDGKLNVSLKSCFNLGREASKTNVSPQVLNKPKRKHTQSNRAPEHLTKQERKRWHWLKKLGVI